MPQKRIFNDDSKTALEPLCLSSDELLERLTHKDGLQELILQNNRDIISGKTYNTTGYVLQLVEYLAANARWARLSPLAMAHSLSVL